SRREPGGFQDLFGVVLAFSSLIGPFSGDWLSYHFFFQAEDGIRDATVTGVQTCALPILINIKDLSTKTVITVGRISPFIVFVLRSEERRVGKECRSRWSQDRDKRKGVDDDGVRLKATGVRGHWTYGARERTARGQTIRRR